MLRADEKKREKARAMRYKKPLAKEMNFDFINESLWEMQENCEEVQWMIDDDDVLMSALDGDEEEAYEFRMMFSDLCYECERLRDDIGSAYVPERFDDIFVAGKCSDNLGGLDGWDSFEGDYFGLDSWETAEAEEEASRRLMRLTKEQLIMQMQYSMRIAFAYMGVKNRYDNLYASLDILKEKNTGHLKIVKKIEEVYQRANEDGFRDTWELDRLIEKMPQEVFI